MLLSFHAKSRNLATDLGAVPRSSSETCNLQSEIPMSIYRRVFRYYRPFLPQTVTGLILSLIGVGLNLLKPWPFKIIVDDVLHPGATFRENGVLMVRNADVLIPAYEIVVIGCAALVLIQFLWGVVNWATNYILVKAGLQLLLKL